MQLTNRKIIDELLPTLKENINKETPELDQVSYYDHPYHRKQVKDNVIVKWVKYEPEILQLKVIRTIPSGKYDQAILGTNLKDNKDTFSYQKEYRDMGNGFYATVDKKGKILNSEWD